MSYNGLNHVDFYLHNLLDINTCYFRCPRCTAEHTKPANNFGMRVTESLQRVFCGHCGYHMHFVYDQIALTFMVKFFPDDPITKNIVMNKHYVDLENTPEHIRNAAHVLHQKHLGLLTVLESS